MLHTNENDSLVWGGLEGTSVSLKPPRDWDVMQTVTWFLFTMKGFIPSNGLSLEKEPFQFLALFAHTLFSADRFPGMCMNVYETTLHTNTTKAGISVSTPCPAPLCSPA